MISQPSSRATRAICCPPHSPCSSPESPARMTELPNSCPASNRAASIAPAIPDALSLAPGASDSPSEPFEARESMSPDMIT